ncbi:probable methyltransferase PMT23 [Trifolium pratense]|uniref:probable methyltransferase PMT23 n=1 Tax=Trifolium pratense TaxID=57577 RepID=UPI001E69021E|nr:probable methyltransferase PMT23 [Trifolium pratense]
MTNLFESLFKDRKSPVIFTLFTLLICVMTLFVANTSTFTTSDPISFYPDDIKAQLPLEHDALPVLPDSKDQQEHRAPPVLPDSKDQQEPPKDHQELPHEGLLHWEKAFDNNVSVDLNMNWKLCKGAVMVDYMPCLDNLKAIKALKSRRHMEHRERHCPKSVPRCLLPLPKGYKVKVAWPKSRDMIWYDNVPHPKLVEYKKEQNWVVKTGEYLVFPGGGTQFKEGVNHYINFIEKTLPAIQWGKNIRVVLDAGCGVASFGGYLLDKNVITMSFAPKDEHEAQIQFALERGIPATLSVIGTQKLTFPDNGFDLIHCARCRVHWDADGGKPLYELNRILRPGGYFAWSATPVYRNDERDQKVWNAMVTVTTNMCWTVVAKTFDSSGIGLVIYQKPISSSCYEKRKKNNPPICKNNERNQISWYTRLSSCLIPLPVDDAARWPVSWPNRLTSIPPSLSSQVDAGNMFDKDTKHWSRIVSDIYMEAPINWSTVRNVMDMNAGYGGFAAALIDRPVWVMNVVPIDMPDTLTVIFDRGLIGTYHDWCESLSTYPRTYDLIHSSFLFKNLDKRCDIVDVVVEIDRILRPDGYLLVQDSMEGIRKLGSILNTLHWSVTSYQNQFLVGRKSFWRPKP